MSALSLFCIILLFCAVTILAKSTGNNRTFGVDYANNCFAKDGQCFHYFAGALHYFRIPHQFWEDRIGKYRAGGVNVIQTYVPWNFHEPDRGQFYFDGQADFVKFANTVQKYGLYIILRPTPYSCAEWDMGGLPWWLLRDYPDIRLRTSDSRFLSAVESWYSQLLPKIKPLLYENGGPILSLQIENEYGGYYACDHNYTAWLRDQLRQHLGDQVLLFTTDFPDVGALKCASVPGAYPTVDFGVRSKDAVAAAFESQRSAAPAGPLVNSEFYMGWFDSWGKEHSRVATQSIVDTMTDMFQLNASFTFYLFHGGTNFGYWNGAKGNGDADHYQSVTTSYDFDAPLNESGDPTEKYFTIRKTIEDLTGSPNPFPMPVVAPKTGYGVVNFSKIGDIFQMLPYICDPKTVVKNQYPLSMETLNHPFGFVLYSSNLKSNGTKLEISAVADRAYVIYNKRKLLGIIQRDINSTIVSKVGLQKGDSIDILIENQGRIDFGSSIADSKGLKSNVTLDGQMLIGWTMQPITLEYLFSTKYQRKMKWLKSNQPDTEPNGLPSIYEATLNISSDQNITDTFFDTTNWGKGQLLINNFNVGRYWPMLGPQLTLYVPNFALKPGLNKLILFELEVQADARQAAFIDHFLWKQMSQADRAEQSHSQSNSSQLTSNSSKRNARTSVYKLV